MMKIKEEKNYLIIYQLTILIINYYFLNQKIVKYLYILKLWKMKVIEMKRF